MQEALIEAKQAYHEGEVPVGAVVVCNGDIIARAHNMRETLNDPSAHAEFLAIQAAAKKLNRWRLHDCDIYVTLEPCTMCAGLMINARVHRCIFGAKDPKAGALTSLYNLASDERLNHSFNMISGVLAEESAQLLKDFFKLRRQKA